MDHSNNHVDVSRKKKAVSTIPVGLKYETR
jgi:hypothetical protein